MQTQKHAKRGKRQTQGKAAQVQAVEVTKRDETNLAPRQTQSVVRLQRTTTGLGLLSLGLGLFGSLAPGAASRILGAKDCDRTRRAIRAASFAQAVGGILVLTRRRATPWLWAGVAGDAIELALVANATSAGALPVSRALLTGAGFVGLAITAAGAALRTSKVAPDGLPRNIHLNADVTVQRSTREVYQAWRDLQSLPRFMSHVESVSPDGDKVRFRARLPVGMALEWEVELKEDVPGEKISWTSTEDSPIRNHGAVSFQPAPGNRGTQVHLVLDYEPPAGALGQAFMQLFGAVPREKMRADLRKFKQILETGSVMQSDASVHTGAHPARPSADQTGGEP
jgi:uncharacterized membrane protein